MTRPGDLNFSNPAPASAAQPLRDLAWKRAALASSKQAARVFTSPTFGVVSHNTAVNVIAHFASRTRWMLLLWLQVQLFAFAWLRFSGWDSSGRKLHEKRS
jgi:hypothetical protein